MREGKKNITAAERRRWLEQFEDGSPVHVIAQNHKRDPRTVKRHIDVAADQRERSQARREFYRGALVRHNDGLLDALKTMRDPLAVIPDEQLTPHASFPRSSLVARVNPPSEDPLRNVLGATAQADDDAARLRELAREHLQQSKALWTNYDGWLERHGDYVYECRALGAHVGQKIEERSGLAPVATGETSEGFHEGFVSWLCRKAIESAAGGPAEGPDVDLPVQTPQLRLGGSAIATSESGDTLARASDVFQDLLKDLADSDQVRRIATLRRTLVRDAESLRRELGDIVLLGMVTGRCTVCKRLDG